MLPIHNTSFQPGTNIDRVKNHTITKEFVHSSSNKKSQDSTTQNKEQDPTAKLKQAKEDRKLKISEGFKRQAELLDQIPISAQDKHFHKDYNYVEAQGFRPTIEAVRHIAKEVLYQLGKVLIILSFVSLGVQLPSHASIGAILGLPSSQQLSSGAGYLWENLQLGSWEAKLEVLNKQIKAVTDPNDIRLPTYKAQKFHIENQIEKQKAVVISEGLALAHISLMNTLDVGLSLLQMAPATEKVVLYTAGAGGIGMSLVGLGFSATELADNVDAYKETNRQLGDLGRIVIEESTPENVKNTLELVDLAAIDYTANHQKDQIKIGIFQNAFSVCSSALGTAAGIVGILVIANVAGVAGVAAASGIGIPVLGGVGVLIAGAVYAVNNRKSIARGLNGLFGPGKKGLKERLCLKQNLDVREWYAKKEYRSAIKIMHKLSFERSALMQVGLSETSDKITLLNDQMLEKAGKLDELEQKLHETLYKKAKQSAKDKTPTIIEAQHKGVEANERALAAVSSELEEVKKNINHLENSNREEAKKTFTSLHSNEINELEAKLKQVKVIEAKIQPLESLFNQLLARKISDWGEIFNDSFAIILNVSGPKTDEELKERFLQKWTKDLTHIEHRLNGLDESDIEAKHKLNENLKKINSYLNNPESGLQAEKKRLEKMESDLISDIKLLKLDASVPLELLKPEDQINGLIKKLKSQEENLEKEKESLELKKERMKFPEKLNFNGNNTIPLKELHQKSVNIEKIMVVDALEQNIENLDAVELESLQINSKKRGVRFDQLDKSESLDLQKRYVKTQIMNAIGSGQIKATS